MRRSSAGSARFSRWWTPREDRRDRRLRDLLADAVRADRGGERQAPMRRPHRGDAQGRGREAPQREAVAARELVPNRAGALSPGRVPARPLARARRPTHVAIWTRDVRPELAEDPLDVDAGGLRGITSGPRYVGSSAQGPPARRSRVPS